MLYDFKSNRDKILKAREVVLNRRAEIIKKQELERDQKQAEVQQKAIETVDSFTADIQKFLDNGGGGELLSPTINVPITDEQYELFSVGDNYRLIQYKILELGFEFDGFDCRNIAIATPIGLVRNFSYVIKLAYPDTVTINSEERALTYADDLLEVVDGILENTEGPDRWVEDNDFIFYREIPDILLSALAFDKVKTIIDNAIKQQGVYATVSSHGKNLLLKINRSQFVPSHRHSVNGLTPIISPKVKNKSFRFWSLLTNCENLGLVVVMVVYTTTMSILFLLLKSLSERYPLY